MALNLFCLQCGTWVLSFCCVEQLFYPQHQVRPCAPVERGHTQDLDRRADITSYLWIPGVPAGVTCPGLSTPWCCAIHLPGASQPTHALASLSGARWRKARGSSTTSRTSSASSSARKQKQSFLPSHWAGAAPGACVEGLPVTCAPQEHRGPEPHHPVHRVQPAQSPQRHADPVGEHHHGWAASAEVRHRAAGRALCAPSQDL